MLTPTPRARAARPSWKLAREPPTSHSSPRLSKARASRRSSRKTMVLRDSVDLFFQALDHKSIGSEELKGLLRSSKDGV